MSAARFAPASESHYMHPVDMTYGPPPGLSFPPGLQNLNTPVSMNDGNGNAHGESYSFSSEGRAACVPSCRAFSAEDLLSTLKFAFGLPSSRSMHGLISPVVAKSSYMVEHNPHRASFPSSSSSHLMIFTSILTLIIISFLLSYHRIITQNSGLSR